MADPVDPVEAVTLAWQPMATRQALAALFALDRRLGDLVVKASEPMLAQIKLAWWRDRLTEPAANRPLGEPLLAELTEAWGDQAFALESLVDGWERLLLADNPLSAEAMDGLGKGRGGALAAFADMLGQHGENAAVASVASYWTRAQLTNGQGPAPTLALTLPRARSLRGLAVLGGLARRALARREPLMLGRSGALAAIRLGMFGT